MIDRSIVTLGKDSRIRLAKEGVLGAYILEVLPGPGDRGRWTETRSNTSWTSTTA